MQQERRTLGENIAHIRKQRGMSQEELGARIGVTAQAVSKWECGGTPDIGSIPLLADVFGVTIENLYLGVTDSKTDVKKLLSDEMQTTKTEHRFEKAFELLSLVITTFNSEISKRESFMNDPKITMKELERAFYYCVGRKEGITYSRFLEEGKYFAIMEESEKGFRGLLAEEKEYTKLFRILANKENFGMLLFLYANGNTKYTKESLGFKLGMDNNQVTKALRELGQCFWIEQVEVETDQGLRTLYGIVENVAILPFLDSVYDLVKGMGLFLFLDDDRSNEYHKPLL